MVARRDRVEGEPSEARRDRGEGEPSESSAAPALVR